MKKGVTIASLIIYIIGLTVLIGIIGSFNANIFSATNRGIDVARVNEQYIKLNMFLINSLKNSSEVNVNGNVITLYDKQNNQIGQYTYNIENKTISYTDSDITEYIVCEFVDDFLAERFLINEKIKLNINITIKSDEKTFSTEDIYYLGRGY